MLGVIAAGCCLLLALPITLTCFRSSTVLPGCQGIGEDLELTLKTLRRGMAWASGIVVVAPWTGDLDPVARILFEATILLIAFSIKIFFI